MLFLKNLFARLADVATNGPLAGPIWLAVICFALSFLRAPLLSVLFKLLSITDPDLQKSVKRKVDEPLQLFLIFLALTPFTALVVAPFGPLLGTVTRCISLFLVFYIFIQTFDLAVFSWYFARRQANISGVVRFFALFILYGIAVLLTLNWIFGLSVLPLLATSTVVSAVLGLALQDTLKNAFAGLNMSFEKSFVEGDWVLFRLDQTNQWYGQVVEIGWRTTKIKTLNNNYAVIPNSSFTNHEIVNFSKPTTQHAKTVDIPINKKADADSVRVALIDSALQVEGVLTEPMPQAMPLDIKQDCVMYQLRFWITDLERREQFTGAVLEQAWKELKELGALP